MYYIHITWSFSKIKENRKKYIYMVIHNSRYNKISQENIYTISLYQLHSLVTKPWISLDRKILDIVIMNKSYYISHIYTFRLI